MSYTYNPIYSHFKGPDLELTRPEFIERMVVETILKSELPDVDRSWSKVFELKHSSSVTQIGRILAQKRGLDQDLAAMICCMHDISVFVSGRVTDHAHKGAKIAETILEKSGRFTEKEIKIMCQAIHEHSDKNFVSKNPYAELVKDADVLDCGLYDGVHDAYVFEKEAKTCKDYFQRIKNVRKELGLPVDPQWDSLEYIAKGKQYEANKKN